MRQDMPCGKGQLVHVENPAAEAPGFTQGLEVGAWFGFAEVDIEVPRHLWRKFEEMCPFFINKQVPSEAVPQSMQSTGRTRGTGKKLLGALAAERIIYSLQSEFGNLRDDLHSLKDDLVSQVEGVSRQMSVNNAELANLRGRTLIFSILTGILYCFKNISRV